MNSVILHAADDDRNFHVRIRKNRFDAMNNSYRGGIVSGMDDIFPGNESDLNFPSSFFTFFLKNAENMFAEQTVLPVLFIVEKEIECF